MNRDTMTRQRNGQRSGLVSGFTLFGVTFEKSIKYFKIEFDIAFV